MQWDACNIHVDLLSKKEEYAVQMGPGREVGKEGEEGGVLVGLTLVGRCLVYARFCKELSKFSDFGGGRTPPGVFVGDSL